MKNILLNPLSKNNKLVLLALDHRGSLSESFNYQEGKDKTEQIIDFKKELIKTLVPLGSGVLIDPVYGLPALKKAEEETGEMYPFLLCSEKTGYEKTEGERLTELEYPVTVLKKMGAKGVKILLFFNPFYQTAEKQFNAAKIVGDQAKSEGLPYFLEIVTYQKEGEKPLEKDELILNAIEYFLKRDLEPDVWKLEFPKNEEGCRKVNEMVGDIPWILLTRGEPFDDFLSHLKTASGEGASGFLAGRSVWQEAVKMEETKRAEFIKTVAANRFKTIISSLKT